MALLRLHRKVNVCVGGKATTRTKGKPIFCVKLCRGSNRRSCWEIAQLKASEMWTLTISCEAFGTKIASRGTLDGERLWQRCGRVVCNYFQCWRLIFRRDNPQQGKVDAHDDCDTICRWTHCQRMNATLCVFRIAQRFRIQHRRLEVIPELYRAIFGNRNHPILSLEALAACDLDHCWRVTEAVWLNEGCLEIERCVSFHLDQRWVRIDLRMDPCCYRWSWKSCAQKDVLWTSEPSTCSNGVAISFPVFSPIRITWFGLVLSIVGPVNAMQIARAFRGTALHEILC